MQGFFLNLPYGCALPVNSQKNFDGGGIEFLVRRLAPYFDLLTTDLLTISTS